MFFRFGFDSSKSALLLFALLTLACAWECRGQIVTVQANDPRIRYSDGWTVQDYGGHEYALRAGDTMSFEFQGTSIKYTSRHNPQGGIAAISLDNGPSDRVDQSANMPVNAEPALDVLWSKDSLDPGQNHTLRLTVIGVGQYGGPYVEVYGLTYTQSNSTNAAAQTIAHTTSISVPSTSSAAPSRTAELSRAGSPRRTAVVYGVLGCVLGVLLGAVLPAAALVIRRRRRHRQRLLVVDETRAVPFEIDARAVSLGPGARKSALVMPALTPGAVDVDRERDDPPPRYQRNGLKTASALRR